MRYKFIILFLFISFVSKAQVYQLMPQYGYNTFRMNFDSTIQIPTFCGVPKLGSNVTKKGALAFDSCNNRFYFFNPKLQVWDTIKSADASLFVKYTDTASLVAPYLRKGDTIFLSQRIDQRVKYSDTSAMLANYYRSADTVNLRRVTSVGLTMPSAFNVLNSPITTSGTIAVTGAGTASQYVRGDGALANFPAVGSGGGGTIYYLNGNTYQRQISGDSLFQMSAIVGGGAGRVFQRNGTGLLASFITDSLKPNQTILPAGVWLFNLYLQELGGGPNKAQIQVKLRKWNGTTLTTIDSSQIEEISNGSIKDLYTLSISLNQNFTLNATDRIVLQFYITNNASNKTISFYTEDNNIASVITTFPSGISSINGLSVSTQYFATGTSGTDFNISSSNDTHTFNLPTASATNRGALSSADWSTFNGKVSPSDTANKWITSVFRKTASDSVFFVKGGVNTFAFKDSAGAAVTQQTYTTGASVTCNNATTWLIIDPSTLRTALTVNLPSVPSPNQDVMISFGGTLTTGVVVNTLTISPTPLQSTTPSFIEVGEYIGYRWNATNSKWYRIN